MIFTLGRILPGMIKTDCKFGTAHRRGSRYLSLVAATGLGLGFLVNAQQAFAVCEDAQAADTAQVEGEAAGETCEALPPLLDLSLPASNAAAALPEDKAPLPEVSEPSASAAAPAPLAVQSSDDSVSARASLQTLRDYNSLKAKRKVEQAQRLAPEALVAPKTPVASASAVDVWSSLNADGLNDATKSVRTGAGLDYKLVKNASVGVFAERSETIAPQASGGDQSEDKVAAYMAFKALPAVTIDTTTQWETATAADPAVGKQTDDKGSIIVAPRIGKSFALDNGQTIAPFVTVKREIDLAGKTTSSESTATDSAGAGVTFTKPDSYSLSVTTDVSAAGASDPASVNSRLQFKLPLP